MTLKNTTWSLALVTVILIASAAHCAAQDLVVKVVRRCPSVPPPAPGPEKMPVLIAAFIPQLISMGVDLAGTALTEAAKTKTESREGNSDGFNFYSLDKNADLALHSDLGCIVIASAGKAPGSNTTDPTWLQRVKQSKLVELPSAPELYIEIGLRARPDDFGVVLTPQLFYVSHPFNGSSSWRSGTSAYVAALSLKDAASLTSFGVANFAFPELKPGTAITKRGGDGTLQASEWPGEVATGKYPDSSDVGALVSRQKVIAAPYREVNAIIKAQHDPAAIPKPTIANGALFLDGLGKVCREIQAANVLNPKNPVHDDRCPFKLYEARRNLAKIEETEMRENAAKWAAAYFARECAGKSLVKKTDTVPPYDLCSLPAPAVTAAGLSQISVTIVETTDASKFVKFLATAFNAKKDDVKTALNDKYNPARREEVADAAAAVQADAREKLQISTLKVMQLEAQLAESFDKPESTRLGIQVLLVQAKIDTNKVASKAGVAAPYPTYE